MAKPINRNGALGRSGTYDFAVQRATAVWMSLMVVLSVFIFFKSISMGSSRLGDLQWQEWRGYFSPLWVKGIWIISILALVKHAWIGVWMVVTDYVHAPWMRAVCFGVCQLILVFDLFLAVYSVYSV